MWLTTIFKYIRNMAKRKKTENKTEEKKIVPEEKIISEDEKQKLLSELHEVEHNIIKFRKDSFLQYGYVKRKEEIKKQLYGTAPTTATNKN